MEVEQLLFFLAGRLKWPLESVPEVTAADRGGKGPDLESAFRAALGQAGGLFRHRRIVKEWSVVGNQRAVS